MNYKWTPLKSLQHDKLKNIKSIQISKHHMTSIGTISTRQHDRQQAANDITESNIPEAVGIYSRRSWQRQCVALRYRKHQYGNVLRTAEASEFVSDELGYSAELH